MTSRTQSTLAALGLAAFAAALAFAPRVADATQRVPELPASVGDPRGARAAHGDAGAESPGWVSEDADSAYHMRRVHRALTEGLPVAERDPLLDHPHGALVPWPPYYTYLLLAVNAPGAPDDDAALRRSIEHRTASLPLVFGVLTAVLAALAAARLGGLRARPGPAVAGGLFAATYYAFTQAAVNYSRLGNGDHHAFVSLLHAAMLGLFTVALARRPRDEREPSDVPSDGTILGRPRAALGLGLAAGALAGVALGTWVASLVYVIELELVLAVLLFVHARRALPGLAPLGFGFHLAALLAVLPAVLSSPWKAEHPWFVINLSWYHLLHLALGALVFAPLLLRPSDAALRRRHPWLVGAALGGLGLLLFALDTPLARGVREGFEWASATDVFMAEVQESMPLLGAGSRGLGYLIEVLGLGVLLLPVVWAAACCAACRPGSERGSLSLLPWLVALPLLGLQAAGQYRFADALAMPLAVLLGWAVATVAGRAWSRTGFLTAPLAALLALSAQFATVASTAADLRRTEPPPALAAEYDQHRGLREAAHWLSEHGGGGATLANWGFGHHLEWVGNQPTVATNFGAYVGEAGFRAPARFFLARDPREALAILEERDVRYVLLTPQLPRALPSMLRQADPALALPLAGTNDLEHWDGNVTAEWLRTMGARLLFAAIEAPDEPACPPPPKFLKLVFSSVTTERPGLAQLGALAPAVWIWEVSSAP